MRQQDCSGSKLIRTSTLSSEFIRNNLDVINTTVDLNVSDKINQMSDNWTREEEMQGRRLVKLTVTNESMSKFCVSADAVSPADYNPRDLVVSCIRWAEKNVDVVTSVDIIVVLEYFVGQAFSIEEKSRIRRNLQFLKPFTITKTNEDSKRLFNAIMAMENPRPRNIEKDLKVFKWADLFVAVSKVLSKYSPNPNREGLGVETSVPVNGTYNTNGTNGTNGFAVDNGKLPSQEGVGIKANGVSSSESPDDKNPNLEWLSLVTRYPLRGPSPHYPNIQQLFEAVPSLRASCPQSADYVFTGVPPSFRAYGGAASFRQRRVACL